ncbi:hypothetical protein DPMN_050315 [Dreissena polymorpha]|uniref:Anoctamin n=1 Tax=Dreissena polymorpha TaxID=45954 RepID=A0A9D4HMW6_DREPO|nr:hypothetical protein DPMN_050315 [Dreissena polymorpha]
MWLKETTEQKAKMAAWGKDYQLEEHSSLYHEYLEMEAGKNSILLQQLEFHFFILYGFLTILVAAFPLGPLCCLLNNIIEIRTDAVKFATDLRRPLAERAAGIRIWYEIVYAISRLAIVSNAFIIALTSDFIPRLVYVYYCSNNQTLVGYTQWGLSKFNTSDFEPDKRVLGSDGMIICGSSKNPFLPECAARGQERILERLQMIMSEKMFVESWRREVTACGPDYGYEKHITGLERHTELQKAKGNSVTDILLGKLRKGGAEDENGSSARKRNGRGEDDDAIVRRKRCHSGDRAQALLVARQTPYMLHYGNIIKPIVPAVLASTIPSSDVDTNSDNKRARPCQPPIECRYQHDRSDNKHTRPFQPIIECQYHQKGSDNKRMRPSQPIIEFRYQQSRSDNKRTRICQPIIECLYQHVSSDNKRTVILNIIKRN